MADLEPAAVPSKSIAIVPWTPIPTPSPPQPYRTKIGNRAKQTKPKWHQCHRGTQTYTPKLDDSTMAAADLEPAAAPSKPLATVPWTPIPTPSPPQPHRTKIGHRAKQNKSKWHQCHCGTQFHTPTHNDSTMAAIPQPKIQSPNNTLQRTNDKMQRQNIHHRNKTFVIHVNGMFSNSTQLPTTIPRNQNDPCNSCPKSYSSRSAPPILIMPITNHTQPTVTTNPHTDIFTDVHADLMKRTSDTLDKMALIENHTRACQQPHPHIPTEPIDTNEATPVISQPWKEILPHIPHNTTTVVVNPMPHNATTWISKAQPTIAGNTPTNHDHQTHVTTHKPTKHVATILIIPNGTTTPIDLFPPQPAGTPEHLQTPSTSALDQPPQPTTPLCINIHTPPQIIPIRPTFAQWCFQHAMLTTKIRFAHRKTIDDLRCTTTPRTATSSAEFDLPRSHNTTYLTPLQGTHLRHQVPVVNSALHRNLLPHTVQLRLLRTIRRRHVRFRLRTVVPVPPPITSTHNLSTFEPIVFLTNTPKNLPGRLYIHTVPVPPTTTQASATDKNLLRPP